MKRTALRRSTPLRAKPKRDRKADSSFFRLGMEMRCAMAGEPDHHCAGPIDPHHVITRQELRKRGLAELEWAQANRMPLCRSAHEAHHSRKRPVPRRLLPGCALEFAVEHDLVWLLERTYPS